MCVYLRIYVLFKNPDGSVIKAIVVKTDLKTGSFITTSSQTLSLFKRNCYGTWFHRLEKLKRSKRSACHPIPHMRRVSTLNPFCTFKRHNFTLLFSIT